MECIKRVCRRVADWKRSKPHEDQKIVQQQVERLAKKLDQIDTATKKDEKKELQQEIMANIQALEEISNVFPLDIVNRVNRILRKPGNKPSPPDGDPPPLTFPTPVVSTKKFNPEPPTTPTVPLPDLKFPYTEKIYIDKLLMKTLYGANIMSRILGRGGGNHKRMEAESGARVYFRGLGVNDGLGTMTCDSDLRLHVLVKANEPRQSYVVKSILKEIIIKIDEELEEKGDRGGRLLDIPRDANHPFLCMVPLNMLNTTPGEIVTKTSFTVNLKDHHELLNEVETWIRGHGSIETENGDTQSTIIIDGLQLTNHVQWNEIYQPIVEAFNQMIELWQEPTAYWFEDHELVDVSFFGNFDSSNEQRYLDRGSIALQEFSSCGLSSEAVNLFADLLLAGELIDPNTPRQDVANALRSMRGVVRACKEDLLLLTYMKYPWALYANPTNTRVPFTVPEGQEILRKWGRLGVNTSKGLTYRGYLVEWRLPASERDERQFARLGNQVEWDLTAADREYDTLVAKTLPPPSHVEPPLASLDQPFVQVDPTNPLQSLPKQPNGMPRAGIGFANENPLAKNLLAPGQQPPPPPWGLPRYGQQSHFFEQEQGQTPAFQPPPPSGPRPVPTLSKAASSKATSPAVQLRPLGAPSQEQAQDHDQGQPGVLPYPHADPGARPMIPQQHLKQEQEQEQEQEKQQPAYGMSNAAPCSKAAAPSSSLPSRAVPQAPHQTPHQPQQHPQSQPPQPQLYPYPHMESGAYRPPPGVPPPQHGAPPTMQTPPPAPAAPPLVQGSMVPPPQTSMVPPPQQPMVPPHGVGLQLDGYHHPLSYGASAPQTPQGIMGQQSQYHAGLQGQQQPHVVGVPPPMHAMTPPVVTVEPIQHQPKMIDAEVMYFAYVWIPNEVFVASDLRERIAGAGDSHFGHILTKHGIDALELGFEGLPNAQAPENQRLKVTMKSPRIEVVRNAFPDLLDLVQTMVELVAEELGTFQSWQIEQMGARIHTEMFIMNHGLRQEFVAPSQDRDVTDNNVHMNDSDYRRRNQHQPEHGLMDGPIRVSESPSVDGDESEQEDDEGIHERDRDHRIGNIPPGGAVVPLQADLPTEDGEYELVSDEDDDNQGGSTGSESDLTDNEGGRDGKYQPF